MLGAFTKSERKGIPDVGKELISEESQEEDHHLWDFKVSCGQGSSVYIPPELGNIHLVSVGSFS